MLGGLVSPGNLSLNSMNLSFKWLQQQQQVMSENHNNSNSTELLQMLQFHGSDGRELKRVGTCFDNNDELQSFSYFTMVGSDFRSNYNMGFASPIDTMDGCISRTNSCQIEPIDSTAVILKNQEENKGLAMNKRKPEFKVRKESVGKKIKREAEAESSIKGKSNISNSEASNSSDTSKEISISKASEIHKPDYIHVRARRGQATDRHSLAERARREKIGMKMKCLQDLVPGCDKITGQAGMLDEIINYVQSLQRQVEFLSMKLALLNPAPEFHIDQLSAAKQFQDYIANLPTTALKPSEMASPAPFQMNQQGSLIFPVINNQTTSKHDTNSLSIKDQHSSSWETHPHGLYNTSSLGFQYGESLNPI